MPYLKIVKRPHECVKPTSILGHRGSRGIFIGTVWECPNCKKQWIVDAEKNTSLKLFWRETKDDEKIIQEEGA